MKIRTKLTRTTMILISTLGLNACSMLQGQNPNLPRGTLDMAQIYQKQTGLEMSDISELPVVDKTNTNDDGIIKADTHHVATFKTINNPKIKMYVYPHLVNGDDEVPIPGFHTEFYLYKSNHFALNTERY